MRALRVSFVFLIVELWAYGRCGFTHGRDLVADYHDNDDNSLLEEARANSWIIHPPPRPMIPLGWYNVVKNGTTMSPMMMMMFGHSSTTTTPTPPAAPVVQTLGESSAESVLPEATSEESPPESLLTETGASSETPSGETLPELETSRPAITMTTAPGETGEIDFGSVGEDKEESVSAWGGESEIEPETTDQPEEGNAVPEEHQAPGAEESAVTSPVEHESEEDATVLNAFGAGIDELDTTTVRSLEMVAITLPTEEISEPLSGASSTTELDESSAYTEPSHHNLDTTSDKEWNENGGEVATESSAESLLEEQETAAEGEKPQGQEQLVTLGQEETLSETDIFTTPALATTALDEKWMTTPQTDDADDETTLATTPTSTATRQFQKRALLEAKGAVEEEKRENATVVAEADLPQARQYLPQRPYPIAPNYMHGAPAYHYPAGYHGYYPDPMVTVARVYEVCYTAWCSVKKSLRRYGLL